MRVGVRGANGKTSVPAELGIDVPTVVAAKVPTALTVHVTDERPGPAALEVERLRWIEELDARDVGRRGAWVRLEDARLPAAEPVTAAGTVTVARRETHPRVAVPCAVVVASGPRCLGATG